MRARTNGYRVDMYGGDQRPRASRKRRDGIQSIEKQP